MNGLGGKNLMPRMNAWHASITPARMNYLIGVTTGEWDRSKSC